MCRASLSVLPSLERVHLSTSFMSFPLNLPVDLMTSVSPSHLAALFRSDGPLTFETSLPSVEYLNLAVTGPCAPVISSVICILGSACSMVITIFCGFGRGPYSLASTLRFQTPLKLGAACATITARKDTPIRIRRVMMPIVYNDGPCGDC